MNDTRQEFEALARTMPYDVTRNATGRYKWYETQCAWEVWQHQAARIAQLEAQVKELQRVPLTDEQVFDAAVGALPGEAHKLIAVTSPEYADTFEIDPCARWTACEVKPEHSLAFARAIEAAHNIK